MNKPTAASWKTFAAVVTAVAAVISAIAVLLNALGVIHVPAPPVATPTPIPEVRITYPVGETVVDQTQTIRGTSRSIPAGAVIWVVVFSPDVGAYYPQDQPAALEADGVWSSTAYIGIDTDANKRFDILALVADRNIQDSFTAYLAESRAKGQWPGLRNLPAGDVPLSRVSVIRR